MRALALSRLSMISIAPPPPGMSPSRSLSKGREDLCGSSMRMEKLFSASKLTIASQFGMVELDREEDEEGGLFLFLECVQAVDEASIRALTKKCLQIEILCGVEYDGWGCEAQAGGVH